MNEDNSPYLFTARTRTAFEAASRNDEALSVDADDANDHTISEPRDELIASTRKIARPEFIWDNAKDPVAKVKLTLMHQRRGNKVASESQPWVDADSFNLANLKAGQQVRMELNSSETKRLFHALIQFYDRMGTLQEVMSQAGITGTTDPGAIVVAGREREVLNRLLDQEGEDRTWDLLDEIRPGITKTLSIRKQHEQREAALNEFRIEMEREDWNEGDWQRFFEWNPWIFGFGLSYRYLNQFETQPHYGGTHVGGAGAERGDYLLNTEAEVRFTVVLEIKKPQTELLHSKPYRNYYHVSRELAGGLAQLHSNCETWLVDGSNQKDTRRRLERESTHVHWPKGILVVGHTRTLDHPDKIGAFERFRQSMHNPEIVTFDELLARAEYLLRTDFDISAPLATAADEPTIGGEEWF